MLRAGGVDPAHELVVAGAHPARDVGRHQTEDAARPGVIVEVLVGRHRSRPDAVELDRAVEGGHEQHDHDRERQPRRRRPVPRRGVRVTPAGDRRRRQGAGGQRHRPGQGEEVDAEDRLPAVVLAQRRGRQGMRRGARAAAPGDRRRTRADRAQAGERPEAEDEDRRAQGGDAPAGHGLGGVEAGASALSNGLLRAPRISRGLNGEPDRSSVVPEEGQVEGEVADGEGGQHHHHPAGTDQARPPPAGPRRGGRGRARADGSTTTTAKTAMSVPRTNRRAQPPSCGRGGVVAVVVVRVVVRAAPLAAAEHPPGQAARGPDQRRPPVDPEPGQHDAEDGQAQPEGQRLGGEVVLAHPVGGHEQEERQPAGLRWSAAGPAGRTPARGRRAG